MMCAAGVMLLLAFATRTQGIDISASKAQGGSTNVQPNKTTGSPSIWRAPFKWMFKPRSEAMNRINAPPHFKVELSTDPKNFTFTSNAVLKARMLLVNEGDEKYILEFPTAQHYDFIISTKAGKEMYRYSADKEFSQKVSTIVLNRNEKLVYEDELFSATNQLLNLPAGDYKLLGQVTTTKPISVETSFQIGQ